VSYSVSIDLIDTVTPFENNPRQITPDAISKVAKSIELYGFRSPIVVDDDRIILAGHTRLLAAQKLGLSEVPVHVATGLSKAKKRAYRLADNRSAEESRWDFPMLTEELGELNEMGFDLADTLFDPEEISNLFPDEPIEGLTDEDEVPEVPDVPVTVEGDFWTLGNHRLMCGDSTSIDAVEKLMNGANLEMIFTDPPYGMNAVSKSGVLSKKYSDIIGDDNSNVAKETFLLIHGLYADVNQIWWGANYYSSVLPDSECWLVWDKNNGGSDQTDCELAWSNCRSVVRKFTQSSEKKDRVHPTQKPVSLVEWAINKFKVSPKTIADFFGGSGSTLIAAEKKNINCFLMEFDPKYCDVIIKRWQDFTGKVAVLEETSETFESLKAVRCKAA